MALGWVKVPLLGRRLIFGKLPAGVLENAVSLGGQLFFAAMSGVLFAYLLPVLTSRNYFLKGLIFGLLIWLLSYTASILFRVPFLTRFDPGTVTSNITGALIYGLVLGFVLKWLEERAKTS